jgi:hypothetical protein
MTDQSHPFIVLIHGSIQWNRSTTTYDIPDHLRKRRIYSIEAENPWSPLKEIPTGRLRTAHFTPCHRMGWGK